MSKYRILHKITLPPQKLPQTRHHFWWVCTDLRTVPALTVDVKMHNLLQNCNSSRNAYSINNEPVTWSASTFGFPDGSGSDIYPVPVYFCSGGKIIRWAICRYFRNADSELLKYRIYKTLFIGISYYSNVTIIAIGRRPYMVVSYPLLKPLTDKLMKELKVYGILEVSTEQYQCICNSIIRFAQLSQVDSYSPELMDAYREELDNRCSEGKICKEYQRFQLRVIRMLSSLAEQGKVDFSNTKSYPRILCLTRQISSLRRCLTVSCSAMLQRKISVLLRGTSSGMRSSEALNQRP